MYLKNSTLIRVNMAVGILYVSELPYVQGSATVFIGSR